MGLESFQSNRWESLANLEKMQLLKESHVPGRDCRISNTTFLVEKTIQPVAVLNLSFCVAWIFPDDGAKYPGWWNV